MENVGVIMTKVAHTHKFSAQHVYVHSVCVWERGAQVGGVVKTRGKTLASFRSFHNNLACLELPVPADHLLGSDPLRSQSPNTYAMKRECEGQAFVMHFTWSSGRWFSSCSGSRDMLYHSEWVTFIVLDSRENHPASHIACFFWVKRTIK